LALIGANKNEEGVNISLADRQGNGFAACGGGFVEIGVNSPALCTFFQYTGADGGFKE